MIIRYIWLEIVRLMIWYESPARSYTVCQKNVTRVILNILYSCVAIDLQLYQILKITRVSFLAHIVHRLLVSNISSSIEEELGNRSLTSEFCVRPHLLGCSCCDWHLKSIRSVAAHCCNWHQVHFVPSRDARNHKTADDDITLRYWFSTVFDEAISQQQFCRNCKDDFTLWVKKMLYSIRQIFDDH